MPSRHGAESYHWFNTWWINDLESRTTWAQVTEVKMLFMLKIDACIMWIHNYTGGIQTLLYFSKWNFRIWCHFFPWKWLWFWRTKLYIHIYHASRKLSYIHIHIKCMWLIHQISHFTLYVVSSAALFASVLLPVIPLILILISLPLWVPCFAVLPFYIFT